MWKGESGYRGVLRALRKGILGIRSTGSLSLLLRVIDLAENGRMDQGDYITVTATGGSFSPDTSCTLMLLYEPTGGSMLVYEFAV